MAAGKKRQLNYELLRIIAMLMIVSLHYLGKGGLLGDPARADMTAAGYTAWFFEAFFLVAVNVYVLISGYFGVDARGSMTNGKNVTFRDVLRKPFNVWKQVFFYSVFFGCITLVTGVREFDLYHCFSYLFPVVTEHYWFATSYFMLYLLTPMLNKAVKDMTRRQLGIVLAGLLILFSGIKSVSPVGFAFDRYGYDLPWFICVYLTGAYLGLYGKERSSKRGWLLYAGSCLLGFGVNLAMWFLAGKWDSLSYYFTVPYPLSGRSRGTALRFFGNFHKGRDCGKGGA